MVEFDFSMFFIMRGFNGVKTTFFISIGDLTVLLASGGRTIRSSFASYPDFRDLDEASPELDFAFAGDISFREAAIVGILVY